MPRKSTPEGLKRWEGKSAGGCATPRPGGFGGGWPTASLPRGSIIVGEPTRNGTGTQCQADNKAQVSPDAQYVANRGRFPGPGSASGSGSRCKERWRERQSE